MGDTDFPTRLGNQMASNPAGYLNDDAARSFAKKYSESLRYSGAGGTDIPYQEQVTRAVDYNQGPVVGEKLIAGPSFDLMGPDIDSPEVDLMLKQLRNTPGYKTPGPLLPAFNERKYLLRQQLPGIKRV